MQVDDGGRGLNLMTMNRCRGGPCPERILQSRNRAMKKSEKTVISQMEMLLLTMRIEIEIPSTL
jgi:hypothetical protein